MVVVVLPCHVNAMPHRWVREDTKNESENNINQSLTKVDCRRQLDPNEASGIAGTSLRRFPPFGCPEHRDMQLAMTISIAKQLLLSALTVT